MKPNATNKASTAQMPNQTTAETQRLLAANTAASSRTSTTAAVQGALSGALPAPVLAVGASSGSPGVFNSAPPGPNNTPQPVPPPQPATSGTGENLDVGDPFVPPGALGRLSSGAVEGVQSDPQIISRDF